MLKLRTHQKKKKFTGQWHNSSFHGQCHFIQQLKQIHDDDVVTVTMIIKLQPEIKRLSLLSGQ